MRKEEESVGEREGSAERRGEARRSEIDYIRLA